MRSRPTGRARLLRRPRQGRRDPARHTAARLRLGAAGAARWGSGAGQRRQARSGVCPSPHWACPGWGQRHISRACTRPGRLERARAAPAATVNGRTICVRGCHVADVAVKWRARPHLDGRGQDARSRSRGQGHAPHRSRPWSRPPEPSVRPRLITPPGKPCGLAGSVAWRVLPLPPTAARTRCPAGCAGRWPQFPHHAASGLGCCAGRARRVARQGLGQARCRRPSRVPRP